MVFIVHLLVIIIKSKKIKITQCSRTAICRRFGYVVNSQTVNFCPRLLEARENRIT